MYTGVLILIIFRMLGVMGFSPRPSESLTTVSDVEIYHLETRETLLFSNITITENGPMRAALRAEVKIGKSTIVTTVCSVSESDPGASNCYPQISLDAIPGIVPTTSG